MAKTSDENLSKRFEPATTRQTRVFISRPTAGMARLAEEVAALLRERDIQPVFETEFLPTWRTIPEMLQDLLASCDCMIALIGPIHGGEPEYPPARLKDPRTRDRSFSYSQWEYLVARELKRPIFTFILHGADLIDPFGAEAAELAERQRQFIAEFAMATKHRYSEYRSREKLFSDLQRIEFPRTVTTNRPCNIPYASLEGLFKGREDFLLDLGRHLATRPCAVIKGRQAIHGMGGVGKTRAAIEYGWKHAEEYRALLFISGDTLELLESGLAALCGPAILNLPEQLEKESRLQIEAVLRWLRLHPGWLLIIDGVDSPEAAQAVQSLLEALSGGHIIITSRLSDWTGRVAAIELDVMAEESAIEFLNERTEERRIRQETDDQDVRTLVGLLDCLSLALEQAGAQISSQALSYLAYLEIWEEIRPAALAWHDLAMGYPRSLAITYEASVAQLSLGARKLLHRLSWFGPAPIPIYLTSGAFTFQTKRRQLSELEHLHLSRYRSDGKSFTIHRLLQEITRQQQSRKRPSRLIDAIKWINEGYPFESEDVRTWPVAIPLVPHGLAAATYGLDHGIEHPSARLLSQVALLLMAQGNYASAEPLARRCLGVLDKPGEAHPNLTGALNNLAEILKATHRLAEAEQLLRRALALDAERQHDHGPDFAAHLNNLGSLLSKANRLAEAEQLMRRALAIDEAHFDSVNPKHMRGLNNLALLLAKTNRRAEAQELMLRLLAADEKCFGPDHPKVATDLNNLACLLCEEHRFKEAEAMASRALMIDETSFGGAHPRIATTLNTLAQIINGTGDFTRAEPLMRRALIIDQMAFGERHPNVAIRLGNLAQLLRKTNRLAEAEPMMRLSLEIDEASLGVDHPHVANRLSNLAGLLQDTGRLAEAEPLLDRALRIERASFGDRHPDVATVLGNLAILYQKTGRLTEAEPLLREALAIDGASYGADHPNTALRLNNLGDMLQSANRLSEAEPLIRRALQLWEKSSGKHAPNVATALNNLAEICRSKNEVEPAERLLQRALSIEEAHFGGEHPRVALILNNLGSLLRDRHRFGDAELLLGRAIRIFLKFTRETSHPHPYLEIAANNLAGVFMDSGKTEQEALELIAAMIAPSPELAAEAIAHARQALP